MTVPVAPSCAVSARTHGGPPGAGCDNQNESLAGWEIEMNFPELKMAELAVKRWSQEERVSKSQADLIDF